ncbi:pyridoxamine 5'-phosphate oxidase family protein [Paracoccus stylophorae]|uniref:Pyridoxamine 5'-phosphate oxidase family protein n=1 Tax=Paracoccus stylophorae TaxID=659350 RepID=A0ABY7SSG2_9RHOB|nr:pyridoxamine 5'-phosphate oxidase family protein [Paracoccus stylophorae]WCR09898.1 pyridoxamine 5'-phosphate oxidase family protein [Paracoccus stylophorae]
MTDLNEMRARFWDRLGDINAGMLGLAEDMRLVPMSHYADRDESALWFITAKQTELAEAAAQGARPALHVVSDGDEGLYARIEGELALSDDRDKLDELWNAVASSWFEDGKRDDDVQLMRFTPSSAEIWVTGGSVGFLYQIAKSKITGDKPDMGEHLTIIF